MSGGPGSLTRGRGRVAWPVTAALTVGSLDAIADGVYQEAADDNAVVDRFAEEAKFGAGVGAVIDGEQPVSFDAFDDDPTNAMDAVLEALSRNPAAAEAVYEATGDRRVQAILDDR